MRSTARARLGLTPATAGARQCLGWVGQAINPTMPIDAAAIGFSRRVDWVAVDAVAGAERLLAESHGWRHRSWRCRRDRSLPTHTQSPVNARYPRRPDLGWRRAARLHGHRHASAGELNDGRVARSVA